MKEWTEIYEQMRGTFAQRAGFVPSEGCDSAVRLYALAAELQSLLMQADWVLDQSFPQTAQGMYLDYHAETRGITRAAAEKAVATNRRVELEPMNSASRREVHAALGERDDVMTRSEGREPDRRVVIIPRTRGGNRGAGYGGKRGNNGNRNRKHRGGNGSGGGRPAPGDE